MKDEYLSKLQDHPVDPISLDFISILTKLVEDNDSLQKRIDTLEQLNLPKRVDALEKSFKLFKTAQHENGDLQKSMSLLITMLQDSELHKKCTELKKESRRPENQETSHHQSREYCKRFKTNDEKIRSSCTNYRDSSSHESRTSPNRQKYSDRYPKSSNKFGKHTDTEPADQYVDHYSRRSYNAEQLSRERYRLDSSQRNSIHHDSKLAEEHHRVVERLNNSEHRKRPEREDGQLNETSLRENKDSKQSPYENRSKVVKDSKQINEYRLREVIDSKPPNAYRLKENKDFKQFNFCRTKEVEESKQRGDYRINKNKESSQPTNGYIKDNRELKKLSDFRTKENKKLDKENKESKSAIDSRIKENKESKESSDFYVKENRQSEPLNDVRTKENRESEEPKDCHLSKCELPDDNHRPEKKILNENERRDGENKNGYPIDPRLSHSRAPKVDIPSPVMPLWGITGEIDLKKIHSTPLKFLNGLPTFLNYSMISPLPTTPDQLKERFKEQETVKVSPMPSFMSDEQFEQEKPVHQPKEEIKEVVEIQPEKDDIVEVKTIVETEDIEHGVFKRRRRAR